MNESPMGSTPVHSAAAETPTSAVDVVRRTFELYFEHLPWWIMIAVPVYLAATLLQTAIVSPLRAASSAEMLPDVGRMGIRILAVMVLALLAGVATAIPLIQATASSLRGEEYDSRGMLRAIGTHVPRVAWVSVRAVLLVTLGYVFFVVPGIYVGLRLALAPIVTVLEPEHPGPVRASWSLTRRHAAQILGVFFLVGIPVFLIALLQFTVSELSHNSVVEIAAGTLSNLANGLAIVAGTLLYAAYGGAAVRAAAPVAGEAGPHADDDPEAVTRGLFE